MEVKLIVRIAVWYDGWIDVPKSQINDAFPETKGMSRSELLKWLEENELDFEFQTFVGDIVAEDYDAVLDNPEIVHYEIIETTEEE